MESARGAGMETGTSQPQKAWGHWKGSGPPAPAVWSRRGGGVRAEGQRRAGAPHLWVLRFGASPVGTFPPEKRPGPASWGNLVPKLFSFFFPSRRTALPMGLGSFQNSLMLPGRSLPGPCVSSRTLSCAQRDGDRSPHDTPHQRTGHSVDTCPFYQAGKLLPAWGPPAPSARRVSGAAHLFPARAPGAASACGSRA